MKRLRVTINLGLAMVMAISIIFVGHLRAQAAPTRGGTINFATWSSNTAETQGIKHLISAFQSKYHISVHYEVLNGDYEALLKTRMTAGTAPDVFYMNSNRATEFIKAGTLKDLGFLKKSVPFSSFFKSVQAGFVSHGKTYGFAKDYSTLAMEYNKDLFSAAGIKAPPKTWAELKTDCTKLTNKSKKQYGLVLNVTPDRWMAFVYQAGGSMLNKNQTKVTINSKQSKQAIDFYAGLVKSGCAAAPASQVGAGWPGEAFGRQNAAMVFEGNWMPSYLTESYPSLNWGLAPLPKGPKNNDSLIFTAAYSMWAKTPHLKDATTLMKFLVGKTGQQLWEKDSGYLSSRKDVKPPAGKGAFVAMVKHSHSWFFPPGFSSNALDKWAIEMQKVMEGKQSSAQALKNMQSQGTAALQNIP